MPPNQPMEKTGAVILAAGGSSRLGQPKQFLLHHGQTLLERSVDAAADCFPTVVVAGRDASRVKELLRNHQVDIVENAEWERGIGTSIRAGLTRLMELAPDLEAAVILLCDQPHITAALVRKILTTRTSEQKSIVACHYADAPGVPALFARSIFPQLLSLADRHGAKAILSEKTNDSSTIAFPEGAIDIDTPAEKEIYLAPKVSSKPRAVFPSNDLRKPPR